MVLMCEEFNDLLQKLKYSNRNKQCFLLKAMVSSIQHATKDNLQELLDFLYSTHDKELQVKLFSILSVYFISNNTDVHIFVTFNPIYDIIDEIVSKNLPRKTTVVLNFLTLLLQSNYVETTMKSSLYIHAQNLIRISGCLATMADMFLSGMMYQDTWRALCRCLAETCNNSEQNQSYCTHLIPKCVKRCTQRNMETFLVLQSLIQNNKRNVELFLECDGMHLFKGDLLQYESSLQLLSTIVETSETATIIAQKEGILKHVHELLRLCGPYTVTGQWATVILYHADINIKGYEKKVNENINTEPNKSHTTTNNLKFQIASDENDTKLLRNVIKEIVEWHTKEQDMYKNMFISNNKRPTLLKRDNIYTSKKHFDQHLLQFDKKANSPQDEKSIRRQKANRVDELSFTFLSNYFSDANNYVFDRSNPKREHVVTLNGTKVHTESEIITIQPESDYHLDVDKFYNAYENENTVWDLKEFKPNFVSTPKQRNSFYKSKKNNRPKNISAQGGNRNGINKSTHCTISRTSVEEKTLKQRSFKARIYDVINNSCTALMNSVTSMFKLKNTIKTKKLNTISNIDTEPCSYSFTEYMRKRDAVIVDNMNTEHNVEQNFSIEPDSCKTCNNTTAMKDKMLNDIYLKETVKKLKVGINMYGCDFKKISKNLWPQEDYMTPALLYNLYRKIIMK